MTAGSNTSIIASPYPLVRVPADPDALADPGACEAFTCLAARNAARAAEARPRGGRRSALCLEEEHPARARRTAGRSWSRRALLKPDEALLNLRDVVTGKTVLAHGGSVYWNEYRRRWVMIAVEIVGSLVPGRGLVRRGRHAARPLGLRPQGRHPRRLQLLQSQAASAVRPARAAGSSSSRGLTPRPSRATKDPTPRYDYNQVMYQLDLADPRLALPVPIYARRGNAAGIRLAVGAGTPAEVRDREVAFFAPDRPGGGTVPVCQRIGGEESKILVAGDSNVTGRDEGPPSSTSSPRRSTNPRPARSRSTSSAARRDRNVTIPWSRSLDRATGGPGSRSGWSGRIRAGSGPGDSDGFGDRERCTGPGRMTAIPAPRTATRSSRLRWKGRPSTLRAQDSLSLEELVAQLERDPAECRRAFVGLESLEQETRLTIVRSLRDVPTGPGVVNLLRHLKGSDDEATRESARVVLDELLGMSGLEATGEERAAGELGLGCGPSAGCCRSGPAPNRGRSAA